MWDTGMGQLGRFRREIGIVALLLLSAGTLYAARTASASELQKLQTQEQSNQLQIQQLTTSLAGVPHLSATRLAAAARALPAKLDIPSVLRGVSLLTATTGVTLQGLQLTPTGAPANVGQAAGSRKLLLYPVTVTVAGTPTQILRFVRGLEHEAPLTRMDHIAMVNAAQAGRVTATVAYSLYASDAN